MWKGCGNKRGWLIWGFLFGIFFGGFLFWIFFKGFLFLIIFWGLFGISFCWKPLLYLQKTPCVNSGLVGLFVCWRVGRTHRTIVCEEDVQSVRVLFVVFLFLEIFSLFGSLICSWSLLFLSVKHQNQICKLCFWKESIQANDHLRLLIRKL